MIGLLPLLALIILNHGIYVKVNDTSINIKCEFFVFETSVTKWILKVPINLVLLKHVLK